MSKVSIIINYAGLQLPVIKNEHGEDVTPLKPISDLFGLRWDRQLKKVTSGGFYTRNLGVCTLQLWGAGSQKREQICIKVSRVAAYLMTLNPDLIRNSGNTDGAEYLEQKLNEWADALHDYELMGVAINASHMKSQEALRRQRAAFAQMIGVKNRTPAANDRTAISQLIGQMADELGLSYQPDLVDAAQG